MKSKFVLVLTYIFATAALAQFSDAQAFAGAEYRHVIWKDPGRVAARDLSYGAGAPHRAPMPPFTFVKEVKSGESPKFDVRDARGTTWRVKLGPEAQSETVATRLVWSVGYFAEESYYHSRVRVRGLSKLSRGSEFLDERGYVHGARFEPRRNEMKEGDAWDWEENPFADTRELNGLKVLMILLNNYDARKENNKVFFHRSEALYYVTDLGATLGKADGFGGNRSKNNLHDYLSTRFVMGVDDGAVTFDFDTRPTNLGVFAIFYPPYYKGEVKKEKAMRGIPVEHARWIGSLLGQLTDKQLHDAFRAARYEAATRSGFVRSIRERIGQLARL